MSDLKANRLALASIWGILNLKEFSKFYLYSHYEQFDR